MHALAGAGRVIGGRYRLRELIGRGAMGAVWHARDELLDRDVAVKEVQVPPALTDRDRHALYQRTLREAKTAARLSHPGVVTVFDVVEEDGRPWIIMELVRARSLDRVLAEDGPLPAARAADIGRQLVGALATAHAAGVLHRDVKPSNVLLAPDGRAVLTDFGIATFEGDERLTQTGMVMGTPEFTPPERILGGPATPSSDLWSLGATLYAAVQGRGPYHQRGDAITTMNAVLHEEPPAAPAAGQLGPVISALMQKHPAARPDAASTSALLAGALQGTGPGAGAPAPASWDRAAAPPLTSWDRAAPSLTSRDPGLPPPPTSRDQARPAPPTSHDPARPAPESWPAEDPGASGSPARPVLYGAPVSDAPAPGAPPYPPGPPSYRAPPHFAAGLAGRGPAGRGRPRSGRRGRRLLIAGAAVAIAAAGVAAAVTLSRSPRSPAARSQHHGRASQAAATLPAGYAWYSRSAASAGTAAGFRLAVPEGWSASTQGLVTYLRGRAGSGFAEVDLTRHDLADPIAEARWLEARTIGQGKFPGYRRISIRPARVSGSAGAAWTFSWQEPGAGRVFAQDYLFDLGTGSRSQSYAVYASAPAASWRQTALMLAEAIRTFQPLT